MNHYLNPAGKKNYVPGKSKKPYWHFDRDGNGKCFCRESLKTSCVTENVKYVTCPRCREKMKGMREER